MNGTSRQAMSTLLLCFFLAGPTRAEVSFDHDHDPSGDELALVDKKGKLSCIL